MGSDHALKYASWYGCFYRPDFALRNSYICDINIFKNVEEYDLNTRNNIRCRISYIDCVT